jgi:transposase InsO family protein
MGRVGACGDNAAMGSFFALLPSSVLDRRRWATREEPRLGRGLTPTDEPTEFGAVPSPADQDCETETRWRDGSPVSAVLRAAGFERPPTTESLPS